jgi:hypothetical protein
MSPINCFVNKCPEKHMFLARHRAGQRTQQKKTVEGKKSIDNIIKE